MKKIALAVLVSMGMLSTNTFAEGDAYKGLSVYFGRSTLPAEKSVSTGLAIMKSRRPTEYYGYEIQAGLFDNSGPFTTNAFVELSAIALAPLGGSGFTLYGKAGLADVYSTGSSESANKLGFSYGAGVEFLREVGIIRVGYQHFNLGNNSYSSSLGTNLIGLTLLLR